MKHIYISNGKWSPKMIKVGYKEKKSKLSDLTSDN